MTNNLPTELWTPAGPARVLEPDPARPSLGRELCTYPVLELYGRPVACRERITDELGEAEPRCLRHGTCDECTHTLERHVSLYDLEAAGADAGWDQATCWAASVCVECQPLVALAAAGRLVAALPLSEVGRIWRTERLALAERWVREGATVTTSSPARELAEVLAGISANHPLQHPVPR